MYTLYYSPGTCSMAVHVLLNELGVPFTLESASISEGKNKSPEYLKINPRGNVPCLKDGELVIREGAAIIVYLLDKHKSPLLPQEGAARAAALEWLMFCNATLHPAYGRGFFLKRNADKDPQGKLLGMTVEQINTLWAEVDARLAKLPYLAGKECMAADILMTVIANWSGNFQGITLGANVQRVLKEVSARPAFRKALQSEGVEYKAAA